MNQLIKIYDNYLMSGGHIDTEEASKKRSFVWDFVNDLAIDKKQEMAFDELLGDMAGAYEERGFVSGF